MIGVVRGGIGNRAIETMPIVENVSRLEELPQSHKWLVVDRNSKSTCASEKHAQDGCYFGRPIQEILSDFGGNEDLELAYSLFSGAERCYERCWLEIGENNVWKTKRAKRQISKSKEILRKYRALPELPLTEKNRHEHTITLFKPPVQFLRALSSQPLISGRMIFCDGLDSLRFSKSFGKSVSEDVAAFVKVDTSELTKRNISIFEVTVRADEDNSCWLSQHEYAYVKDTQRQPPRCKALVIPIENVPTVRSFAYPAIENWEMLSLSYHLAHESRLHELCGYSQKNTTTAWYHGLVEVESLRMKEDLLDTIDDINVESTSLGRITVSLAKHQLDKVVTYAYKNGFFCSTQKEQVKIACRRTEDAFDVMFHLIINGNRSGLLEANERSIEKGMKLR